MSTSGQALFKLAYETSPIILKNGIASFIPGGYLPIQAITQLLNLSNNFDITEDFAHYKPLPGSTLIDFSIGEYPFASLQTAANATVQNPLRISLLMVCPAQNGILGGYIIKPAILTALQSIIQNHILRGGTFIVATPAYIYTDCLLTSLRDVGSPTDTQVQLMFQWDFVQPLIQLSGANARLNNLMNSVSNQFPVPNPLSWSSAFSATGGN